MHTLKELKVTTAQMVKGSTRRMAERIKTPPFSAAPRLEKAVTSIPGELKHIAIHPDARI